MNKIIRYCSRTKCIHIPQCYHYIRITVNFALLRSAPSRYCLHIGCRAVSGGNEPYNIMGPVAGKVNIWLGRAMMSVYNVEHHFYSYFHFKL